MSKNRKKSANKQSVGSLIIKDRFSHKHPYRSADSFLHTSELEDGYNWGRLNLQSVTEQNQLDDFLATAELAGTEFTAEKLNIQIVGGPTAVSSLPTELELEKISEAQEKYRTQLRIPRRPAWHGGMSAEELQTLEQQSFLEWRRGLAELQEQDHILITPFEKNLDFWRQLWRVIERSDIVVQIVDSRNPLLFRCEDLEAYVKEVDNTKVNVILINKSDFLTPSQRQYWCDYFNKKNIRAFFWSAKLETEKQEALAGDPSDSEQEEEKEKNQVSRSHGDDSSSPSPGADTLNTSVLYTATELVEQLKLLSPKKLAREGVVTIGLVGYPNVGKSSTINAILQAKKCPVSATPGRTKHFQTIYIDQYTMLCDCPGLVMPSFVTTKADMILNGILPIDKMRDHKAPINTLAHRIPRASLEYIYGITIRKPKEGEDPHRSPTDLEILNAYGAMRGFMTSSGVPDNPRSARILLKDFVNGKLLYCEPPPEVYASQYQPTPDMTRKVPGDPSHADALSRVSEELENVDLLVDNSVSKKLDSDFFKTSSTGIHVAGKSASRSSDVKLSKKHGNRKRKEKARRLYGHLDKHDAY